MKAQPFDDETLMAFADGELDEATAMAVEEAITRDDELMARVAMFMETRIRAKAEMAPLLDEPIPAELETSVRRMVETSRKVSQGTGGASSKSITPFEQARNRAWRDGGWALPLAASLVAAIAAGVVGYQLGNASRPEGVSIVGAPDADVVTALQTVPSGGERQLAGSGGQRIRMVSSFRDQDGVFCREYEIDAAQGPSLVAVSCREENDWNTRIAIASPLSGDGYAPASSLEALETYLAAINAGPALSQEEEAQALTELPD